MTPRDRVLSTFEFRKTDRVPYDLARGCIWPDLAEYFRNTHRLETPLEVLCYLGTDFRWVGRRPKSVEDEPEPQPERSSQTDDFSDGPLRHVESIAEIESHPLPDPSAETEIPDLASFAQQWPDHARVVTGGAVPLLERARGENLVAMCRAAQEHNLGE